MIGFLWLINIFFSFIEAVIGFILVILFLRGYFRFRARLFSIQALLSFLIYIHASLSMFVSLSMALRGEGPELASYLMPLNLLGLLIASILFYIVYW